MRRAMRAGWASKVLLLPLTLLSQPAAAEIVAKSESGFVIRLATEVTAPPDVAWRTMTTPAQWWSSQHTFSGDAANLTFDPVVGGCFCETLPRPQGAPASQKPGGVQHMRVVYIEPPRAMRLVGALGPLQSEALSATMTMTVKPIDTPAGKGSRILFEYVVGGYMRYKIDEIAPAVDGMLAAQLLSLAGKLGPIADPDAPAAPSAAPATDRVGPPAPGAEDLLPAPAKPVGPLKGADSYSLPPAARPAAKAPAAPAPKPASKIAAKPAPKPAPRPAAKPTPKAPNPDDAAHRDANSAFDALLGAEPAP